MFNYGQSLEEVMEKNTEASECFETVAVSEEVPHKATGKANRMHRSEKARSKRKLLHEKQEREHVKGYKGKI